MMNTPPTGRVALTALLILPLFTGCSAAHALFPPDTSTTPEPSRHGRPPAPIEGDTDGDGELSEFEKQVLARHSPP